MRASLVSLAATLLAVELAPSSPAQCLDGPPLVPGFGYQFGDAAELLGEQQLLVGARLPGQVFVYRRQGAAWVQEAMFSQTQGSTQHFGRAVAWVDATRVLVGAPGTDGAHERMGAVYAFQDSGAGWGAAQEIIASDANPKRDFGHAVDADGDWAVVGAPATYHDTKPGAAYFFEWDGMAWVERQKVRPALGAGVENGSAVAIEGLRAVVVSGRELGPNGRGVLHVYDHNGASWVETAAIPAPAYKDNSWQFGWSVALEQGRILVGTLWTSLAPSNTVFVYEESGGGWVQTGSLAPRPGTSAGEFGHSVAASGARAATAGEDFLEVFEESAGCWIRVAHVPLALDGSTWNLPSNVALGGDTAVVGDPLDDPAGAAYTAHVPAEVRAYCGGAGCPCGNDDGNAGCANSTKRGAWIEPCGSTSVTADDLLLTVEGLVPQQFALLYMGGGAGAVPLGAGLQCVASGGVGVFRFLPAQGTGPEGSVTLGPGIVARSQSFAPAGHIDPGETWHFQCWYRDPGGPCGAAYNFSSALAVTFAP